MHRNWELFAEDILTCIERIRLYTRNMNYEEFISDTKTQDAVMNNLRTIGEAVRAIPEEVKQKHSNIPWREITAFRNFLIHEYFRISLEIIWETIKNDLPELEKEILQILREKK